MAGSSGRNSGSEGVLKWCVHIHPIARTDILDVCNWYDRQRDGLGREFLLAIEDALTQLEQQPLLHRVYYRGLRRILTRRFPYKLFYFVYEADVHVLRVLHGRQNHRRQLRG